MMPDPSADMIGVHRLSQEALGCCGPQPLLWRLLARPDRCLHWSLTAPLKQVRGPEARLPQRPESFAETLRRGDARIRQACRCAQRPSAVPGEAPLHAEQASPLLQGYRSTLARALTAQVLLSRPSPASCGRNLLQQRGPEAAKISLPPQRCRVVQSHRQGLHQKGQSSLSQ